MPQRRPRTLKSRVKLISKAMQRKQTALRARLDGGVRPPTREGEEYGELSKNVYWMIHAHAIDHSARQVGLTSGQAKVFRRHIENLATDHVAKRFNPFTTKTWSYVRLKVTGKGGQFEPPISPTEERKFVEAYNRNIETISQRVLGGMGEYVKE